MSDVGAAAKRFRKWLRPGGTFAFNNPLVRGRHGTQGCTSSSSSRRGHDHLEWTFAVHIKPTARNAGGTSIMATHVSSSLDQLSDT